VCVHARARACVREHVYMCVCVCVCVSACVRALYVCLCMFIDFSINMVSKIVGSNMGPGTVCWKGGAGGAEEGKQRGLDDGLSGYGPRNACPALVWRSLMRLGFGAWGLRFRVRGSGFRLLNSRHTQCSGVLLVSLFLEGHCLNLVFVLFLSFYYLYMYMNILQVSYQKNIQVF
jgi:hypothetical protein